MRDHIKILGILNIVLGSLGALIGVLVMVAMGGLATFLAWGVGDSASDIDGARAVAPWMGLLGVVIAGFIMTLSIPSIIGGWGLLKYKRWSRVLMIIVSALNLLHIPIGTALGVYGLWVLTNDQAVQLLETGGTMPPPPVYPMQQRAS